VTRRYAVVDVGTNTVRLLVADVDRGHVERVDSRSHMTRLGRELGGEGRIGARKVAEVADIVSEFSEHASLLGAIEIRAIATSAAREAVNGDDLVEDVRRRACLTLEIIDEDEEARLAFYGALTAIDEPLDAEVGVVDLGGGSTEIVVGSASDGISFSCSCRLGSGRLTDRFLEHDPPRPFELERARHHVDDTLPDAGDIPPVTHAVAVGGTASNLRRLVGGLLDHEAFDRARRLLSERPSRQIARQFGIEQDRARILPGGLLVLEAASARLRAPLWTCRAGIREGAVLDLAAARML
jgi:exopolyphosphatase/guanosine-5'-triphosphate,3'-diphosphate pyrophosphatase